MPPPRGLGGRAPKTKTRGVSCQLLSTCLRVGLKTLANHQQTRVGKNWGWRGLAPSQGALGDVPPKQKQGVSYQLLPTCHRVGPKTSANPQQTKVGKNWGVEGAAPPPRGHGRCAPKTKTRGELVTLTNLPPSGIQNLGKPSANEGREN